MLNYEVREYYDKLPYFSSAFHDSSILRLHAIGEFLKLKPTLPQNSRVLEIGASYGGNIMPFAVANPQSEVVGIDISTIQVRDGNLIAKQIDLENFTLICADITNMSSEQINDLGKFDYIIAHGFYSWVQTKVKNALLAFVRELLNPNGIAYISYNVYPGWKSFDILRDFMLFSAKGKSGISRLEVAKDELKFMRDFFKTNLQGQNDKTLEQTQRLLLTQINFLNNILKDKKNDYYVLHEFLENTNEPQLFYKFANRLNDFHLSYLVETTLDDVFSQGVGIARFDRHINENYKSRIDKEQVRDFLLNRSFRKSLVVHSDILDENIQTDIGIDEISRMNLVVNLKKDGDNFMLKDTILNSEFNDIYNKIYTTYPSSVSLSDLSEYPNAVFAFLSLMANQNVLLSSKNHKLIRYEIGKSRLKPRVARYISYFANTDEPAILMANELNEKVLLDRLGARLAVYFDGKNSIDEIYKKFKSELDTKDKTKDFVMEVKTILENNYFLENF